MIKAVENKEDIIQFAKLGVAFSKRYPGGIANFLSSELNNFNQEKNSFLKNGGKIKAFLLQENDDFVGRVAAMINPNLPDIGLVGLFDCVDNQDNADELLKAAVAWLKQNGKENIIGPFNFTIYHSYRFMISGFDEKPYVGEPRNPDYYNKLFKKFGFIENHRWDSRFLKDSSLEEYLIENKKHAEIFKALGYKTEKLNNRNKAELMSKTYNILIEAYRVFPLFTHISKTVFLDEYKRMPDLIDRDCSQFVYNPEGKFLGFFLVLKDLAAALKSMNGKSDFLAKLKFLLNRDKIGTANIYQGATTHYFIREAAVLGKRKFDFPLSLASAVSWYAVNEILESGRYNSGIFTLLRSEGQWNNHIIRYDSKREYAIYELKID